MEDSPRQAHKLFHKLAQFKKRQLRNARSEDALSHYPPELDSTPALPTGKILPAYTPMPVPQRTSSAKAEAVAYHHQTADRDHRQEAHWSNRMRSPNVDHDDRDDLSIGLSAFNEELLRPQSPVSPMGATLRGPSLFPSPPMMSTENPAVVERGRSRQPVSPEPSRERVVPQPPALVSPPTPAESSVKGSLNDSLSPVEPKIRSPPESVSYYLNVPAKLGPQALAQLQTPSPDKSDVLDTELSIEDDPDSWDVIKPNKRTAEEWDTQLYSLEKRAEQLYSAEHLHLILEDTDFHAKFTSFLRKYRPWRLPILTHYWDACKAIKALNYANYLAENLSLMSKPHLPNVASSPLGTAANSQLYDTAKEAFDELLREDLHWYIANTYIGIVCAVMRSRITGNLPAPLREASHGLAEVFCITDPTRRDNPIILASQAFTRHSGCNMDYILGRNCRFMQGPGTTVDSCRRFAISMEEGRDHSEIFVNYRRDGSPFLSLVMNAQLLDSHGNIRYYLGAQVDVSGLLKNCTGLDSLTRLVEKQARQRHDGDEDSESDSHKAIKALSEMLSGAELDVVGRHGGLLQRGSEQLQQNNASARHATLQHNGGRGPMGPPRVLLADGSDDSDQGEIETDRHSQSQHQHQQQQDNASVSTSIPAEPPVINLSGVYKYYLIVRPAPSLRILFASPTLRVPGILQSQFLHRIGSARMRKDLHAAFQDAKVITARVRWLKALSADGEGEGSTRWIHCTPLIHHTGAIGLWMIVVILPNEDQETASVASSKASRTGSRMAHYPDDTRRVERTKGRGSQR